ncbi:MAG: hypothetical protein WDN06_21045 [Asticcacaulis sp.]
MLKHMTLDAHTSEERLTPEARRGLLRAFADRMLIKATAMDDPEDMPGIERAVRVAAVIERLYSRCDRAESHSPDPRKLEAERARNTADAIESRVALAGTLRWGEKCRKDLGRWWDAAETASDTQTQALATAPGLPQVAAKPVATPVAQAPVQPTAPTQAAVQTQPAPRTTVESRTASTAATPQPQHEPAAANPAATTRSFLKITPTSDPLVTYVDYTDAIANWRVALGFDPMPDDEFPETPPGGHDPPSG